MARWAPHASDRLQHAAFELFVERGYIQTTVAEIATRAGVTERTFFRHFADKREVFFSGDDQCSAALIGAIDAAGESTPTLQIVMAGIEAAEADLPAPEFARRRRALLLANPELRERESIKLASIASSINEALRRRGTPDTVAELAAETGIVILRVALIRWSEDHAGRPWKVHVHEVTDELYSLTRSLASGRVLSPSVASSDG